MTAATVAASLSLSLAPPAVHASPRSTSGLFGAADPTFDGAYRQSMAILGLSAARAPIPGSAVAWMVGQQCASGAFQAFRADTTTPCAAPDPTSFTGPDSNSTALAAMALRVAKRSEAAARAVRALLASQNTDGGWGYTLGGASDVNSTGLALAAISGVRSATSASQRATRYLRKAQVSCKAPVTSRFGLPYQPGGPADVLASGQALIGLVGTLPVVPAAVTGVRRANCSSSTTVQVTAFLYRTFVRVDGMIPSALDSTRTDWNATATAVLAMAAAGGAPGAVTMGIEALGLNTTAYTGVGANASPAAIGTLIQAAVAGNARPRSFGITGTNLVSLLMSTLQK